MIFAIIAAVLAYRKAKDAGRNAWGWAFIAAGTFIGTQLIVALALGVLMGIFLVATERGEDTFKGADILITIIAVIFSFGTTWLVLKYLDRNANQNMLNEPPPPPPPFGNYN